MYGRDQTSGLDLASDFSLTLTNFFMKILAYLFLIPLILLTKKSKFIWKKIVKSRNQSPTKSRPRHRLTMVQFQMFTGYLADYCNLTEFFEFPFPFPVILTQIQVKFKKFWQMKWGTFFENKVFSNMNKRKCVH